jgi:WD40 repeat protein
MGTFRAVKIVSKSAFKDSAPFERELAGIKKFEPVSRAHEGFVDLLQIGRNEEEGVFYYVMEAADDVRMGVEIDPVRYQAHTLAEEMSAQKRLPIERCISLALALSRAVGYLHSKGLVHRDIKPSNIIFVNGSPKLADVGLVSATANAHSFVGTAGFIPPEGPGTEQADVYSLGKVLYEMATGLDRKDFPSLPSTLVGMENAPGFLELNEVILKACQPDPGRRYGDAGQMAEDLNLLASGGSLRRLRVLEKRWERFRRLAPAAVVALIVAAILGYQADLERKRQAEMRERQVGSHLTAGSVLMNEGDLIGSLPHLVSAFDLDRAPQHELTHQVRIGSVLVSAPRLVQMLFLSDQAISVEFSADDRFVMVAEFFKKIRFFDLQSGKEIDEPIAADSLNYATMSPDNRLVAAAFQNGAVGIWDVASRKRIHALRHPAKVLFVRFNPAGDMLASGAGDGKLRLWDVNSGSLLSEFSGTIGAIKALAWSPDGKVIAITSGAGQAELWDVSAGRAIGKTMQHEKNWIAYAAFSPDGRKLVTAGHDFHARLWAIPSCDEIASVMRHANRVSAVAFSPDGNLIASSSFDSTVRFWEVHSGLPLVENPVLKNSSSVVAMSFNANGSLVGVGCSDGTVRIWELKPAGIAKRKYPGVLSRNGNVRVENDGQLISMIPWTKKNPAKTTIRPEEPVSEVAITPDGNYVLGAFQSVTKNGERAVRAWDSRTGEELPIRTTLPTNTPASMLRIAITKNFTALGASNVMQILDTRTAKAVGQRARFTNSVSRLVFDDEGKRLLICEGNSVHVWDTSAGTESFPPKTLKGEATVATFSPDGRLFATASSDLLLAQHPAEIWDAQSGERVGKALWHRDGVLGGKFSPDGAHFATASEDFTAAIWEIATGKPAMAPLRHEERALAVNYNSDGGWIATAAADKSVRIWNSASGEPLIPWLRHNTNVVALGVSAESPRIVGMDSVGEVWEWTLPRDGHSREDLPKLARLLASELDPEGQPGVAHIQKAWQELSAKYPEDFARREKRESNPGVKGK